MQTVDYILGHSEAELRRLTMQAAVLRPITERLLREAGIAPGMRVLDIGSGTGDVAMLAAELVGPSGAVVGVDRSSEAVATAAERANAAGHRNIEFVEGAVEEFAPRREFDFAIGRYVLVHQAEPATLIRAAAANVRPDGIVAFHELALYGDGQALPPVPLWAESWGYIVEALGSVLPHPDAGGRMTAHFAAAGLGQPRMFVEVLTAIGKDSPLYAVVALSLRNVLPQLEKIGAVTAADVDVETLEQRLGEAVSKADALMIGPMQFCGWTRCPERLAH